MQESDTYLMILEEGQAMAARDVILIVGEERFGLPNDSFRAQLKAVIDLPRLERMVRIAAIGGGWQEILDTP